MSGGAGQLPRDGNRDSCGRIRLHLGARRETISTLVAHSAFDRLPADRRGVRQGQPCRLASPLRSRGGGSVYRRCREHQPGTWAGRRLERPLPSPGQASPCTAADRRVTHPRAVDLAFADELRLLTAKLRLEAAVFFVEPTDSMADVYAAADIVINPSRTAESFGRVAPEALMAGTPVVATSVGAVPEVIRDGVDGLLVKPDDPHALATAVGLLVEDPALAKKLAETGRRHVIDRFGMDQDLEAWRQVIDSVLGPRTTFRPGERPA